MTTGKKTNSKSKNDTNPMESVNMVFVREIVHSKLTELHNKTLKSMNRLGAERIEPRKFLRDLITVRDKILAEINNIDAK